MRRLLTIPLLLALFAGAPTGYKAYPLHGDVGKTLPPFLLQAMDGHFVDSYEFRGSWTLIAFFASWCGPCNQEMPRLVRDAKRYHLDVIAIDERDSKGAIAHCVAANHLPFTIMIDPPDLTRADGDWHNVVYGPKGYFGVAEEAFSGNALPGAVLVDPEGIVRAEWSTYDPHVDPLADALAHRS